MSTDRFACPSSGLSLGVVLKRGRKALVLGSGLALGIHFLLAQLTGDREQQWAQRPLTTQFVKRAPRLTKPLELKKRPQPKRRQVRREMVAVKARMQREQAGVGLQPTQLVRGLAKPSVEIGRISRLEGAGVEPQSIAQAIESAKEDKQKVDMSLELLDLEALDTGRYHALVIQESGDRRSVRGFCHLAIVYSRSLYPPPSSGVPHLKFGPGGCFEVNLLPGFLRIPEAMNKYTDIRTDILGRLSLDDAGIFKAPWICFLTLQQAFKLTTAELENLGKYLMSGGFVFEDSQNYWVWDNERQAAYISLRNAVLEGLATQDVKAAFEKLPNSHPIYHSYFDFDGPPIGSDGFDKSLHGQEAHIISYTEGIDTDGRLVALLSGKYYAGVWTYFGRLYPWDPSRAFKFAVNTIVFALTQEGSITHRLMDSIQ